MKLNKYSIADLHDLLANQLQKDIEIELKDKVLKKGKLDLFKIELNSNQYDISVYLGRAADKPEIIKIPYPFSLEFYSEDNEDQFYFDYRLTTFCNGNRSALTRLKALSGEHKKSKYLDNILVIKCKNHQK